MVDIFLSLYITTGVWTSGYMAGAVVIMREEAKHSNQLTQINTDINDWTKGFLISMFVAVIPTWPVVLFYYLYTAHKGSNKYGYTRPAWWPFKK